MAKRPPRESEGGYIMSMDMRGKLVANKERVFASERIQSEIKAAKVLGRALDMVRERRAAECLDDGSSPRAAPAEMQNEPTSRMAREAQGMAKRPPREPEGGYIMSMNMRGKLVANKERAFASERIQGEIRAARTLGRALEKVREKRAAKSLDDGSSSR